MPETLAKDGDPLDRAGTPRRPDVPRILVRSRVVGVFWMRDEAGPDAKLLTVLAHDPTRENTADIDDLPRHLLHEIEHFFSIYKDLEPGKMSETGGVKGTTPRWPSWRAAGPATGRGRQREPSTRRSAGCGGALPRVAAPHRRGPEDDAFGVLADLYTDDAVYVDAAWGRIEGKAAIAAWLVESMVGLGDWSSRSSSPPSRGTTWSSSGPRSSRDSRPDGTPYTQSAYSRLV